MKICHWLLMVVFVALFAPFAAAQEAASLFDAKTKAFGWTSSNGAEFPGAKVDLAVDESVKHSGKPTLKLTGDFTGGGNYVAMHRELESDVKTFSTWLKLGGTEQVTFRFVDSTDQCHQINVKVSPTEDWQRVTLALGDFFAKRGMTDTVPNIAKYESWGGKGDSKWYGPAKLVSVLIGPGEDRSKPRSLWLGDTQIMSESAVQASVIATMPLEEVVEGEPGWNFSNGQEFPGAKGGLRVEKDQPEAGKSALVLSGDFTGGGAYVETSKDLKPLNVTDLAAIRVKIKSDNVSAISMRLIDGTGQVHQKGGLKIVADGKFHELVIKPSDIAGGEHWSGANDGKWHGSPQLVTFILGSGADTTGKKQPMIAIADAVADAIVPAKAGASAYVENFEKDKAEGWTTEGSIAIDSAEPFKGKQSLVIAKSEANLREQVRAVSPAFPVAPGAYEIKAATKTDMQSMDNSYNGSVVFEALNASGGVISTTILAEPFRKTAWKPVAKQVTLPEGAAQGRFRAQINKETPGKFWIDELSATPIVVAQKDDRIKRLMFTTAALGNLLLPTDSRVVTLTVLAAKPLPDEQRKASVVVKDYWGAEQIQPIDVALERKGKQNNLFTYEGTADLAQVPLEIGKYFEVHAWIDRKDDEPFKNYAALAILPEAPANSFKAEEIPWTSRNWDNRLEAFVRLTKRLGVRVCGVWGGWSAEPPYKGNAPQLKLIEELGMGWLTGVPSGLIEGRGKDWEKYDEKALREGARNFVKEFGHVRPLYISLGNEPHTKGDATKIDINAYRILYDEFKKIDPTIKIVGTSVGTGTEEYFVNGFGEWCDVYDFHVYEDAMSVRKTIEERYPAMFKKYGHAKPIWSTELGLNSQGLARQSVAGELYKKTANFFAGGGENMSWFGLLYPDGEGTQHDSGGSAHNVFDCRYNKYAPKLDAVAYYNAVNLILNKKFVVDRVYEGGTRVYLFRDSQGNSLLICYKEKGRTDAFIPLPGVQDVNVIRIDGTHGLLNAGGKGVGITISDDPILLTYQGGPATLPEKLETPPLRLADNAPASIVRSDPAPFEVSISPGTSADRVTIKAPPMWLVTKERTANAVRFSLQPPENTTIREADMLVGLTDESGKTISEVVYRPGVTGTLSVQLLPEPGEGDSPAKVKVSIRNNSPQKQDVAWDVALFGEQVVKAGVYRDVVPTDAYFGESPSGIVAVEGKSTKEIVIPIAGADLMKVYRAKATVRDASGRIVSDERPLAGFVAVPRATTPLALDGSLDDAAWKRTVPRHIGKAEEFFSFKKKAGTDGTWQGPQDLSAELRFLWDDQNLYVGVSVIDDIAGPIKPTYDVWQQDGLQFLIDPMRTSAQKVGKYDYGVGDRPEGAKAQCFLQADNTIQLGDRPEIIVKTKREKEGSGNITYEIAIPWKMIAPFKPGVGANLGLTMIVNEDDGEGRDSYLTWFGNANTKDVDRVGDLLLKE